MMFYIDMYDCLNVSSISLGRYNHTYVLQCYVYLCIYGGSSRKRHENESAYEISRQAGKILISAGRIYQMRCSPRSLETRERLARARDLHAWDKYRRAAELPNVIAFA